MSRHNIRARVYIGRLPSRATERDVTKFFKSFGRIIDIQLKNGYGFVEFDDPRDADDAVYDMNGRELAGERVIIEHAKGPPRSVVERDRYRGGYGRGGYDDRRRRRRSRSKSGSRSRSRSRDRRRKRRSRSRSKSRSSRSKSRSRSPRDRRRRESPPRRKRSPSRSASRSPSRSRSRSASPPKKAVQTYRIEIANIPSDTNAKELEEFLAAAGQIVSCDVKEDGKGYVEYEDESAQTAALEKFADLEFKETKLTLTKVTTDERPAASRSRSRSMTRSRSRSSSRGREGLANGKSNGNGNANRMSQSRSRSRSESRSSRSRSRSESPHNGNAENSGSEH